MALLLFYCNHQKLLIIEKHLYYIIFQTIFVKSLIVAYLMEITEENDTYSFTFLKVRYNYNNELRFNIFLIILINYIKLILIIGFNE